MPQAVIMKSSKVSRWPARKTLPVCELHAIYRDLHAHFGHQKWWPGDTPFEIMIGAILTQNTAWTNVEKAIANLKKAHALSPEVMRKMPARRLAQLIRPSGYFNVKAQRLKHFIDFLFREYNGDLKKMFKEEGSVLRTKLLAVKGIGPETADSILLYAAGKPFFVIDAYTRRIFERHRIDIRALRKKYAAMTYDDWQKLFAGTLPQSMDLYNDFHAQIVALGKNFCRPSVASCETCPLHSYL